MNAPARLPDEAGLSLSALVASRICHDLISPVGAIGNGMELLALAADGGEEERALISDCAETAKVTLEFVRIAFGARAAEETTNLTEVKALAARYFALRKTELDWRALDGADVTYGDAKLLLLLALAGGGAMPFGGLMVLTEATAGPPARYAWRLSASRIAQRDRAVDLLSERPTLGGATPGEAHLLLLWMAAEARGMRPIWRTIDEADQGADGLDPLHFGGEIACEPA
ncbi:MAG: histidine phosphotransferase family protein [Pseudomonadota bacterium]